MADKEHPNAGEDAESRPPRQDDDLPGEEAFAQPEETLFGPAAEEALRGGPLQPDVESGEQPPPDAGQGGAAKRGIGSSGWTPYDDLSGEGWAPPGNYNEEWEPADDLGTGNVPPSEQPDDQGPGRKSEQP